MLKYSARCPISRERHNRRWEESTLPWGIPCRLPSRYCPVSAYFVLLCALADVGGVDWSYVVHTMVPPDRPKRKIAGVSPWGVVFPFPLVQRILHDVLHLVHVFFLKYLGNCVCSVKSWSAEVADVVQIVTVPTTRFLHPRPFGLGRTLSCGSVFPLLKL